MQELITTSISEAFDSLVHAFAQLEMVWTDERSESGLAWAFGDARHHVCHALTWIEDITHDPVLLVPHAAFAIMDDVQRFVAHEAYLSVLSLGQLVLHAREQRHAPAAVVDAAERAVWRMLEELAPYVSRADGGLRRTMLDGVPLEDVLADMSLRS